MKTIIIILFFCIIFSSCQQNNEIIQNDINLENNELPHSDYLVTDDIEISIKTFYDLSYDEYFSKEYLYEDHSIDLIGNYNYGIDDAGRLYMFDTQDKTKYKQVLFSDGIVNDYAVVYNELIYSVEGKTIYSSSLFGTYPEIVFEVPLEIKDEIDTIFCTPELIWMKIGESIYRFHRSSGIIDKIYTNSEILFFRPLSNYSFEYQIYNPKWIEYINNGGSTNDWVPFNEKLTYIYNSKTGENYEASFLEEEPYTIIYFVE